MVVVFESWVKYLGTCNYIYSIYIKDQGENDVICKCSFILVGSFKCYQCGVGKDQSFTEEQCEQNQNEVECSEKSKLTCFKRHIIKEDNTRTEERGCRLLSDCEAMKKKCEDEAKKEKEGIKECGVACCESKGDKPCNGAITNFVVDRVLMVIVAVIFSLRLF